MRKFLKKHERKILILLIVLFSALAVFSASKIIIHEYQSKKSSESFSNLSELVKTPAPDVLEPMPPSELYKDVLAQNSDFVGWLEIDGTDLSYPVVQSETRNYYLRRGFDKAYNYYGVPYVSEICDVETSDNVVIYGHNMNNGTMFAPLEQYTSKTFYETHKYIKFNTLTEYKTYEVIAVVKTVAYSDDEFEYFRFESGSEEQFNEYVSKCKSLSLIDIPVTAQYGDKLITLSTCEYTRNHGRLAIIAKRVK